MSIDIARIRLVCFDVDGTLSDTDDVMVYKASRVLALIKKLIPSFDHRRAARRLVMGIETPANVLYSLPDHLGLDDEVARLVRWMNRLGIGKRKPPYWMIDGMLPMLEEVGKKYPLMVISARDETGTMAFLDYFNLPARFQAIITGQTCEHTKPYPDPILHAARMAGVDPAECLMVGDTTVDILSARRAGAQSIGVLCGFGDEKELRRAGADLILPTTAMVSQTLLYP